MSSPLDDALPQLDAILLDAHDVPGVVRPVLEEVAEPALKKSFVQLAEAGHSPQELIDQAWAEAQQDGRFGGCGLGGHAQTTDASMQAPILCALPPL